MPVYLFLILFLCFNACGLLTDNDQDHLLTVKPVSAVEAALEIQAYAGSDITIYRDDAEVFSFHLARRDTIVYDAALEPATSYRWRITSRHPVTSRMQVSVQQATTLDTTSSNFTWQTFSFGEHSSSVLYGVSIIDENNIWAVGEIHMNDSTGQADSRIYNAVHWDGSTWTLKRINVDFRGNDITIPLEGVQGISPTDIWMAGSLPVHGDGQNWNIFDVRSTVDESLSLWEIWGIKPNDVYAAGRNGSMAHWDGENWQKIETNTELDFYDIHGNDKQGVVAVAAKYLINFNKTIVQINNKGEAKPLTAEGIPYPISGIWFDNSGVTYVVGSGMYRKPDVYSSEAWQPFHEGITNNYLQAIDASGLNDIVVAGAFGELLHFNGAKWSSFIQGVYGNLYDIDLIKHTAVAVGYDGRQAFITIGTRE